MRRMLAMRGWQSSPPAPSHSTDLPSGLSLSAPDPLESLHAQRGPWWGRVKFCCPPRQGQGAGPHRCEAAQGRGAGSPKNAQ